MRIGILFFALIVILALIIGIFFITKNIKLINGSKIDKDDFVDEEIFEENFDESSSEGNIFKRIFGGGGGGTGGEGVSGGATGAADSSGSTSGCATQQISYSAANFNANSVCNNQDENGFCIDKTVTCSITINNLDGEIGGIFEISFRFFEQGNSGNILFLTSSELFLEPGEQHTFEGIFNVQSQGEQGDANKDLTCFYNTINIPRKEVC